MLEETLAKLANEQHLSFEEAYNSFREILSPDSDKDKIATYLLSLQEKGYAPEEIAGCGRALKEIVTKINCLRVGLINISSLSNSSSGFFNIDIATSFVVAGCGIPVAQNYANPLHKKSAALETLNSLDINLKISPDQSERCINDIGITFIDLRRFFKPHEDLENTLFSLKTETIFDYLSVIISPAPVNSFLIGTSDPDQPELFANAFKSLAAKRAMVVRGEDNLDGITTSDRTKISEFNKGEISTYFISSQDFGIPLTNRSELMGGDAKENATIIKSILEGNGGAKNDLVVLNAAAALLVNGTAKTWEDGINKARQSIKFGRALSKLKNVQNWTRNCES